MKGKMFIGQQTSAVYKQLVATVNQLTGTVPKREKIGPAWPFFLGLAIVACQPAEETNVVSHSKSAPVALDRFETNVHLPKGTGFLNSTQKNQLNEEIGIHCDVCHGPTPNAIAIEDAQSKEQPFHNAIRKAVQSHGKLNCAACHNGPGNFQSSLHTADQKSLAYSNVIHLCGQCHGSQYRDYQHGLHGGMNGYWDLKRGPRIKNNCLDCHNPHAPAYPLVAPAPPPKDRSPLTSKIKEVHNG